MSQRFCLFVEVTHILSGAKFECQRFVLESIKGYIILGGCHH